MEVFNRPRIARLWHGYTLPANAEAYERHLSEVVLPGIHRIAGYRGAQLMRRDLDGEIEFVVLTFWDSMEAIRAFAGDDESTAVVPDTARALLQHWDDKAVHYSVDQIP
jgi:hypothetical protein